MSFPSLCHVFCIANLNCTCVTYPVAPFTCYVALIMTNLSIIVVLLCLTLVRPHLPSGFSANYLARVGLKA